MESNLVEGVWRAKVCQHGQEGKLPQMEYGLPWEGPRQEVDGRYSSPMMESHQLPLDLPYIEVEGANLRSCKEKGIKPAEEDWGGIERLNPKGHGWGVLWFFARHS